MKYVFHIERMKRMEDKQINILGQEYTIKFKNMVEEPVLEEADGECRWYKKEIVIRDDLEENKKHVIKHEIIHAFFAESGLREYRQDELIVDWIAWNIDKIKNVIDEVFNEQGQ